MVCCRDGSRRSPSLQGPRYSVSRYRQLAAEKPSLSVFRKTKLTGRKRLGKKVKNDEAPTQRNQA